MVSEIGVRWPCLVVALVVILGVEGSARACSCAGIPSLPERVAEADAAFVGTVVEVDVPLLLSDSVVPLVDTPLSFLYFTEPQVRTRFEVERRYRGPLGTHVVIDSGDGLCCNCSLGNAFSPGERWLVFAGESEGELRVGQCRWPLSEDRDPEGFAAALQQLGPGDAPTHPTPRWTEGPHGAWVSRWLVPMALIGATAWWWGLRRQRS